MLIQFCCYRRFVSFTVVESPREKVLGTSMNFLLFQRLLAMMNPNIRCVLSESIFDETYISPWRTEKLFVLHIFTT
jgi:hypothetical protein